MRHLLLCLLFVLPSRIALADEPPAPPPADDWGGLPPPPPATPPVAQPPPAAPAPATPAPAATPATPAPPPATPDATPAPAQPPAATTLPAPPPPAETGVAPNPAAPATPATPTAAETGLHSPATAGLLVSDPGNLRRASSFSGPVGLLRVESADPGPMGTVRFGLHGGYFRSSSFPVQNEPTTATSGTLTLAYTPLDWLEVYGAYRLSSTRHEYTVLATSGGVTSESLSPPVLLEALGDLWVGGHAGTKVAEGLWLGGDLRFIGYTGVEQQQQGAFGVEPRGLLTYDFREANPDVPIRAHLDVGIHYDNTSRLVAGTLNGTEAYALDVSAYTRFLGGAGLEFPLPVVTPFLEYVVEVPLGAPATLDQPDGTIGKTSVAIPVSATLGARVTALQDVSFLIAGDLGLQQHVVPGVIPTPPWSLLLGVTYTFDPAGKGPTISAATPAAVVVTTGKITGQVLDATTKAPIPGALLTLDTAGKPGLPPVASDAGSGKFQSYDVPAGAAMLVVSKEGYKALTVTVAIEAGKDAVAQVLLERDPNASKGTLKVSVRGPTGPAEASVDLTGPAPQTVALQAGEGQAQLPPGAYRVKVTSPGHLSREGAVEVISGQVATLAFELAKKPKNTVLIVKKDRILTRRTIQFRTNEAEILGESYPILDEVAAAIIDAGYKKIRVEGNTDNKGKSSANQKLSEARAASVRDYLVRQAGIDGAVVDFAGYGDSHPVAPNLTARGRAMNRRVEFAIVEP